jgi:hypothetical protein
MSIKELFIISRTWQRVMAALLVIVMMFGNQVTYASNVQTGSTAAPLAVPIYTLQLNVISANDSNDVAIVYNIHKGDPVTQFKYIINEDNTGTTLQRSPESGSGCSPQDVGYPDSCDWVSVAGRAGHSPVFTQGDQDDFVNGLFTINGQPVEFPDGRYLISIVADNFRIDGAHFTIPFNDSNLVTVQMQPYDLPTATIQSAVFEDMASTNSAPDLPGERGLAGFRAHIADYVDEVTTDVFGNPLGAEYDSNGDYVPGSGGVVLSQCYVVANGLDIGTVDPVDTFGRCPLAFTTAEDPLLSVNISQTNEGDPIPIGAVIEGKVIIPNVGPNRYALSVVPPNESQWIQTTTLEGNHDWDAWVMEGATGLDTEFVVAGEPFPATFFGFVRPSVNTMASGSNTITGVGLALSAYIPPVGGVAGLPGWLGAKPKEVNPIHRLFVSLSDINNGDQTVFVGEFDCDESLGCPAPTFTIPNVPDGDYVLGVWDEPQDYIFAFQNVTVSGGTVDVGNISLLGWWTTFEGYVFNDLNENGFMDLGEPGISGFPIGMRTRENSLMDRGATLVTTDANGYYWMENTYPMTQWLIMEAYADSLHTTGISYYADNQVDSDGNPIWTTVLGAGVDVNVHPVIGLGGRLDWGVKEYNPGENGGIVGTISYDTTRNEMNPAYAALEDWQPSIADLIVDLYATVPCGTNLGAPCDATGLYELAQDGSYALGPLLNQYLTETWERPSGCTARNVFGEPLIHGVDENVLPLDPYAPCIEAPMMGVQFGPLASDVGTPNENFGATVDGNYGFGDGCFLGDGNPGLFDPDTGECVFGNIQSLPSNQDYLVRVEIPDDEFGRPLYQVTREEDINVAFGDSFVPQIPPPICAGPLHTVDIANFGTDGYPQIVGDGSLIPSGVVVPASAPTLNPAFVDIGGTIYEGQQKPLCDTKLVRLSEKKSIAPGFNLFTDVPLPGRFWGLLVDDLNFSSNPQSMLYGEKSGISFAPVGIYDYTNRLITTVESDFNGLFDVLLPSTNRISCPTPSGVCANLYRFVGNDPGIFGRWNANYNPQYRTISAEFEAFAGLTIPADLAPTRVATAVQIPGSQTLSSVVCTVDPVQPQLLAVDIPYVDLTGGQDSAFNIAGFGFGTSAGMVMLDDMPMPSTVWTDSNIAVTVPSTTSAGPHQLSVVASNGLKTINGLTFHVFNSAPGSVSAFPTNAAVLDSFNNPPTYNFDTNWGHSAGFTAVNNTGTDNDFLRIRGGNNNIRNAWWTAASFGNNQEAYFTFTQISGSTDANEQGLLLKFSGSGIPDDLGAHWIEVTVDNNGSTDPESASVRVRTKQSNSSIITEQLEITGTNAQFSNGDQLGARAMSNGDIIVYKNGSEIGSVDLNATQNWVGTIGLRFEGTGGSITEARVDDFGGGNTTLLSNTTAYAPTLFEVGPGHPFSNIQSAIDAAASQNTYRDSLVVVYPGTVDQNNPRYNGRGAYYENPIMYAPVQLQGVGPGGVRPDNSIVQGSIIDGLGFGGDTSIVTNWLGKIGSLSWDGNQDVSDGQVIYVLASQSGSPNLNRAGAFTSTTFKPSIDGFNIRGGNQQGLPGNLQVILGIPPDLFTPPVTQGGAIFANSFVNNLQITNNLIEGNGSSYGSIRIGTPNLTGSTADNNNDNLRIANNRIIANGGTNLAGAIGLFNGSDNYEIANNDLCGNYSAEYGGAISHFGLSLNGKIHDNRIFFNHSYDEGAGIMIAGELPANPNNLSEGSGPVEIYNNLIEANLANDDGGGLRFLMAGNYRMNVYNNIIVDNISTHEGGGVALDDAPDVRFYNNTVMKNVTTATAITSDGSPAPAGFSTGQNSAALQATLPGSAPLFSDPLMFNNIFWDNRAGYQGADTVQGIGAAGDPNPINNWDMGSTAGFDLSPTNSVLQTSLGTIPTASNVVADPFVIDPIDIALTFANWRVNINNVGAIIVTADLSPASMGDYHLSANTSPAIDLGAAIKSTINAPDFDIDNQGRPAPAPLEGYDSGADEFGAVDVTPPPPPPSLEFPFATILDDFTRTGGASNVALGANWSGLLSQLQLSYRINRVPAQVQVRTVGGLGLIYWNPATFSANQEAYFTFTDISTAAGEQSLILKRNGALLTQDSFIEVLYDHSNGQVRVVTLDSANGSVLRATFSGVSFANGDQFGARTLQDGTVTVYKNGTLVGTTNITSGVNPWPNALVQAGGQVGVWFVGTTGSGAGDAHFDNFGGGSLP